MGLPSAPRVLVAVASRHGATRGIGLRITEKLSDAGIEATYADIDAQLSPQGFDAYVVGSAFYAGRWLSEAREFVKHHRTEFAAAPVWLFSSGPVGEGPDGTDPIDLQEMSLMATSRGHRLFGGLLDHTKLGIFERAITSALRAPEGDYRPWPAIEAWSSEIAAELVDPTRESPRPD
jgi:menaquinone-dependent protoporphyrinogen oxidase